MSRDLKRHCAAPVQIDPATGQPSVWPIRDTIVHWAALLPALAPGNCGLYYHPAESCRGDAALWDMTPVLSCWPAVALEAGQVGRHIPRRAASHARVHDPGCGDAVLCCRTMPLPRTGVNAIQQVALVVEA
jgi:hypothetical protein